MPFLSPSLQLPALGSGRDGQGFLGSCLHHCLLVHLGALPHHSEVRDATHQSTDPGPGWGAALRPWTSAQQDVLLTTLQQQLLASGTSRFQGFYILTRERQKATLLFTWVVGG